MDWLTVLTSVLSSLGVSVAGAWWLGKKLLAHRLEQELEKHKAEVAGEVKERVETTLGERAADREYLLDARKRLYQAIGPLRFQLLIACRDLAYRVERHSTRPNFSMELSGYYGVSSLFRLIKPLAIGELIERQVFYADFTVDTSAVELLRLKHSAFLALSGSGITCGHPNADWHSQEEHIVYDRISQAVNSIIVTDEQGTYRILDFDGFNDLLRSERLNRGLSDLASIVDGFSIIGKPLFWLRLIALGHICREHLKSGGAELGFNYRPYKIRSLLEMTEDPFIISNIGRFEHAVERSRRSKL